MGAWLAMSWLKSAVEDTTASVAVLTRGVNLEWESAAITPGTPLSPGLLKLKSGIAQIEFYQGARVLIEGPAELQLISSGEATCTRGKLSANVPPQAKVSASTRPKAPSSISAPSSASMSAMRAPRSTSSKARSSCIKAAESMKSLKEGQAMAFAPNRNSLAANASSFASLNEINARTALSDRSQFERWRAREHQLNADPGFEAAFRLPGRRNSPLAAQSRRSGEDGSIVGASWTTGRWPGKARSSSAT
jgi:hypothetical protein